MAKSQFTTIEIRYLVNVKTETIENMFTHQKKEVHTPDGDQHIFEMEGLDKNNNEIISVRSFCKKGRSDIGKDVKAYKIRQPGPVCTECAEAWKADPRSPWHAWETGEKIKSS